MTTKAIHIKSFLMFALLGGALACPAGAAVIVHSTTIDPQAVGWSETVNLPQFDPNLGALQAVTLRIIGNISGDVGVENLEDKFSSVAGNLAGSLEVFDQGNQLLLTLNLLQTGQQVVDPFDNNLDYGGTSGYTFGSLTASGNTSAYYIPPGHDLTPFVGVGTIQFYINAADTSFGSSSGGNFAFWSALMGGATLEISYTTGLIPEPTTMAHLVVAAGICYALRRRHALVRR
jgi:hypothetical protein